MNNNSNDDSMDIVNLFTLKNNIRVFNIDDYSDFSLVFCD